MPLIRIERYKDLRVEENVDFSIGPWGAINGLVIHNDGAKRCKTRPKVVIGKNFHCGKKCLIRTSDHDYLRGYPMVNGALSGYRVGDVTIGDHVWFGEGVLVMKGVTIGSGVIVQSRSVVVSDLPDLAIAGGHPCRPFAQRSPEDFAFFKSLKMERGAKEDPEGQLARFEAALRNHRGS